MATLKNSKVNSTQYVKLPVGNDSNRPSTPQVGMIRYNSSRNYMEVYNGSGWVRP